MDLISCFALLMPHFAGATESFAGATETDSFLLADDG